MKHFKHTLTGEVFAFEEDGSQDHLIYEQLVEMSVIEVKQHVSPKQRETDVWDDVKEEWIDGRTPDQILAEYTASLPALTRRQFRLTLNRNGMLTQVESAIEAITDPVLKADMQIEYLDSDKFFRTSESVLYMCSLLGLTTEQVNAMWEQGLSI